MFLDEQATDDHKQKPNYKLLYKPQELVSRFIKQNPNQPY